MAGHGMKKRNVLISLDRLQCSAYFSSAQLTETETHFNQCNPIVKKSTFLTIRLAALSLTAQVSMASIMASLEDTIS